MISSSVNLILFFFGLAIVIISISYIYLIIDVRIPGDEYCDGGLNLNDMIYAAKVERVEEDKIYYTKDGLKYCINDADTLVFASGYRPDPLVKNMLRKASVSYTLLGDAAKQL